MAPFGGCDDDVTQSRYELRLMCELELLVVDVQPDEDALDGGLEMVALEESAKLKMQELRLLNVYSRSSSAGRQMLDASRMRGCSSKATYVRHGRSLQEGCVQYFRKHLRVASTENDDGVVQQGLLSVQLGADAFGDHYL